MPAAAVASRTPSTGGMSGNWAGASGDTAVVMRFCLSRTTMPGNAVAIGPAARAGGPDALSASRVRRSVLGLLGRLVETLDLCALAQLADELGLRLAGEVGLDLVLHLDE